VIVEFETNKMTVTHLSGHVDVYNTEQVEAFRAMEQSRLDEVVSNLVDIDNCLTRMTGVLPTS